MQELYQSDSRIWRMTAVALFWPPNTYMYEDDNAIVQSLSNRSTAAFQNQMLRLAEGGCREGHWTAVVYNTLENQWVHTDDTYRIKTILEWTHYNYSTVQYAIYQEEKPDQQQQPLPSPNPSFTPSSPSFADSSTLTSTPAPVLTQEAVSYIMSANVHGKSGPANLKLSGVMRTLEVLSSTDLSSNEKAIYSDGSALIVGVAKAGEIFNGDPLEPDAARIQGEDEAQDCSIDGPHISSAHNTMVCHSDKLKHFDI